MLHVFSVHSCDYEVEVITHDQSGDIAGAVSGSSEMGAGDQGIMYGFACTETLQLLPLPVVLAHRLTLTLTNARKLGTIQGLGPDGKAQVSVEYHKGKPARIAAVVLSCQHDEEKDLEELRKQASASGSQEDAQKYNDYANLCSRFEKKLHDLELTRMISIQMGPQTRMIQNNDTLMLEKIQSSLVNTIPLWKSQMVLALGLEHSRQATAAQAAVTNMTNDLLKKNAEMLKMGTIETAKEAERSIVDIETLQHTNQQLISTLDEVMQIQKDGAQKRREAELELGRIEGELKQKLLELRG